jgi:hypothetical protein
MRPLVDSAILGFPGLPGEIRFVNHEQLSNFLLAGSLC